MANGGLGALMYGTVKDREEHLFLTWNSEPVGVVGMESTR